MAQTRRHVAVRAARSAGNIILRYMNRIDGLNVVEKQRMDFVSEVDKLAEAEIIKELAAPTPTTPSSPRKAAASARVR